MSDASRIFAGKKGSLYSWLGPQNHLNMGTPECPYLRGVQILDSHQYGHCHTGCTAGTSPELEVFATRIKALDRWKSSLFVLESLDCLIYRGLKNKNITMPPISMTVEPSQWLNLPRCITRHGYSVPPRRSELAFFPAGQCQGATGHCCGAVLITECLSLHNDSGLPMQELNSRRFQLSTGCSQPLKLPIQLEYQSKTFSNTDLSVRNTSAT